MTSDGTGQDAWKPRLREMLNSCDAADTEISALGALAKRLKDIRPVSMVDPPYRDTAQKFAAYAAEFRVRADKLASAASQLSADAEELGTVTDPKPFPVPPHRADIQSALKAAGISCYPDGRP